MADRAKSHQSGQPVQRRNFYRLRPFVGSIVEHIKLVTETMAISTIFDIEEIKVYDLYHEAALNFSGEMKKFVNGRITVVDKPEAAAKSTDAIITVTQSKEKFLKDAWVEPGTVVFPMGSYQECDNEFILAADRIIVDHVGQCLHRGALKELSEAGKVTEETIYATIGELAAGKSPAMFQKTNASCASQSVRVP